MKSQFIILLLLVISSLTFYSCDKEDPKPDVDKTSLIGVWKCKEIKIANKEGSNEFVKNRVGVGLEFENDTSYYKNYVAGRWTLKGSTISLDPTYMDYLLTIDWEINKLSEDSLILESRLLNKDYPYGANEFEEEEEIIVTEFYIKSI